MHRLGPHDPGLYPKHKLLRIEDGCRTFFEKTDTGEISEFEFDAVVVSLGVRSNTELGEEIQGNFKNVFFVGDALKGGRIESAISGGYKTAFEV